MDLIILHRGQLFDEAMKKRRDCGANRGYIDELTLIDNVSEMKE